ncbi:MAG: hypothetical protein K0R73_285 [Candidatus Midichloriaceae bacterium]|jgi:hypothetical protein|nr:hypothetical protein [Candidatus Midichloriaceae bacterium]
MFESIINFTGSLVTNNPAGANAVAGENSDHQITRQLDEKNTFERIIYAINNDGKVYSQGIAYVGAFVKADGTSLTEYVKTLDKSKINFCGKLTKEELESADFAYDPESAPKINLLEYLVGYYARETNRQKFNKEEVTEIISTLVDKGASFDIETYEKAKSLHINLADVLLKGANKSSVDDLFSFKLNLEPRTLEAIIFNAYLTKPIEEIFPAALTSAAQAPYKNLFIRALKNRGKACIADLKKEKAKESEISSDLTVSCLSEAIVKDAGVSKEIKRLEGELEVLSSTLSAAEIDIKFDELLKVEHELFNFLSEKEKLEAEIVKITEMIAKDKKTLTGNIAVSKASKEHLGKQVEAFKEKWEAKTSLSFQEEVTKKSEAEAITRSKHSYDLSLTGVESMKRTIAASKGVLEQQKLVLSELNGKIAEADKTAKEVAKAYNELVINREKKRNYKNQENKIDAMKLSDFGTLEQFQGFLNAKNVSTQQKGVLLKECLESNYFNYISPIMSAGVILDMKKHGHKQENILTVFAKHFNSSASPVTILLMAHMCDDVLKTIQSDSSLITNHHFKSFTQNPAFQYLLGDQDKEASKGK